MKAIAEMTVDTYSAIYDGAVNLTDDHAKARQYAHEATKAVMSKAIDCRFANADASEITEGLCTMGSAREEANQPHEESQQVEAKQHQFVCYGQDEDDES